jgi:hypothetical protein
VTLHDPVIAALSQANPVPGTVRPGPQERAEAERILRRVVSSPARPRHRVAVVVPVLSTLVALAVVGLFLRAGGVGPSGAPAGNGTKLIFQAVPTAQTPVISPAALSRDAHIVRERLRSVGGSFRVTVASGDRIAVSVGGAVRGGPARIVQLVIAAGELFFYDWEANALTPNGQTVASQLAAQNPTAVQISQGVGSAPGVPGAGSMSLYAAVSLAARQPQAPVSKRLARIGSIRDLVAQLPPGVNGAYGQVRVVPQGTIVLQAASQTAANQVKFTSPSAQFYVLRDNVSLLGNDVTNPQQSTDQSGSPDVQFGFTTAGQNAFQSVTAQIAHRGASVSRAGSTYDQHFAVALDTHLLTVPSIDFKQYPDGIIGSRGGDITGVLTTESARDLATELRYSALPLQLRPTR